MYIDIQVVDTAHTWLFNTKVYLTFDQANIPKLKPSIYCYYLDYFKTFYSYRHVNPSMGLLIIIPDLLPQNIYHPA